MLQGHNFHIPVMGTGFTIDSPVKVAKYGISSVISLVDDTLIEQMREFYCHEEGEPYMPITKADPDWRARRITEYLNLLDRIVKREFANLKSSPFAPGTEITKYFEMLPENSPLKQEYCKFLSEKDLNRRQEIEQSLRDQIRPGRIDVNIMTKLDRVYYDENQNELPAEFSDALSALRGFANSNLESAIVLSAGFNRKLYSYIEKFKDFFADHTGKIKKEIILKVSDFRSSITQGKFLVKKGLWISEFRVESGLNCGGHAFVSAGSLMGPILEEFKTKKNELIETLHELYNKALALNQQKTFDKPLNVRLTAQGGIGTAREHESLLNIYEVDSIGWGTPFLLVPEVTNVDETTLNRLVEAGEDDLYISDSSPLGIPFNNLRTSTSEEEKQRKIAAGNPGSNCIKGHLATNCEFTEKGVCRSSRSYQQKKLQQIEALEISESERKMLSAQIIAKACICHELGNGALLKNGIAKNKENTFSAICPGPNLAYFSRIVSLKDMIDHIYGRVNLLNKKIRPHMFIKELQINFSYFIAEVKKTSTVVDENQIKHLQEFRNNLQEGITYYREFFLKLAQEAEAVRQNALAELNHFQELLDSFILEHAHLFPATILTK